jgi:hypothetical protein
VCLCVEVDDLKPHILDHSQAVISLACLDPVECRSVEIEDSFVQGPDMSTWLIVECIHDVVDDN